MLDRLAASGVRAERLIPVFPTKTFPVHYSMVTGLYPEHHGVVANFFYDPILDASFSLSDPDSNRRTVWWEDGEPIWVNAERQGLTTATYFWPGSEAEHDGIRPTYWRPYDQNVPYEDRIDQVLDWLDLDDLERPGFVALYFDLIDSVAHSHDPDSSPQVADAIRTVDGLVGRLLDGLAARGQRDRVNLIAVSDHGMAATSRERVIFLDDYLDLDQIHVADWSPVLSIWPRPDREEEILEALSGAHPRLTVYRKAQIPDAWHYRAHRRIAPILAVAEEGWTIARRSELARDPAFFDGADHGYEPFLPSMGALFIAQGPDFRQGVVVPPFEVVHLYAMMCEILGLVPAPNDGDLQEVQNILRQ